MGFNSGFKGLISVYAMSIPNLAQPATEQVQLQAIN
jgi:hypothetical protein